LQKFYGTFSPRPVLRGVYQFPFGPKPKFFVPPMRSAVLFPKLASTGADLVFATVFPSAWKLPDGFSQFVP